MSQVTGMESEMAKLVALLQDSIGPASKKRKEVSDIEGPENQFLANPTNDGGNDFNGNQFVTNLLGDQFSHFTGRRNIGILEGQMPLAA